MRNLGGGEKSELKDFHLIFSQMNMDLCLQMVNAHFHAAGNAAQIGSFKCLKQMSN